MARVHLVKKARKRWKCEKCGRDIEPGDPYAWVKPRPGRWARGRKRSRCNKCPLWMQSELSFSKMAGVLGAQEDFAEVLNLWTPEDTLDGLEIALEGFAIQVREVADDIEQGAENIEEGFGHSTYQSDGLREKADSLRDWADDVESAFSDIDQAKTGEELQDEVDSAVGITDDCPV